MKTGFQRRKSQGNMERNSHEERDDIHLVPLGQEGLEIGEKPDPFLFETGRIRLVEVPRMGDRDRKADRFPLREEFLKPMDMSAGKAVNADHTK